MTDNDSPWWGPDKQEQSSQTSSDTSKNVFSGDVSNFSTPEALNVTQMKDPNQFLVSDSSQSENSFRSMSLALSESSSLDPILRI